MPGEVHFSFVCKANSPNIYWLHHSKDADDVTYQRNKKIENKRDLTTDIMELLADERRGVAFDAGKINIPGWVAVATQVGKDVFIEMTDHGFNWMLMCEDCNSTGCSKCNRKGYLSEEEVASSLDVVTDITDEAIGKAADAMGLGIAGPLLALHITAPIEAYRGEATTVAGSVAGAYASTVALFVCAVASAPAWVATAAVAGSVLIVGTGVTGGLRYLLQCSDCKGSGGPNCKACKGRGYMGK